MEKILSKKGRVLFTHFGISGPTVINMSRDVGELLKWGPVEIQIDLFPTLDYGMMNKKLQELFDANKNKLFKNCISEIIPSGMISSLCLISGIPPETPIHSLSREQRLAFIETTKHLKMSVDHLFGTGQINRHFGRGCLRRNRFQDDALAAFSQSSFSQETF